MLQPGETKEVYGSGKKPYVLKNIDGSRKQQAVCRNITVLMNQ